MTAPRRVVIVGGGITGLSCALRLQAAAAEQPGAVEVTLLEASPRLGGKVVSERVGDFVVDGGADIFLASKPDGVALCESLGIADHLLTPDPRTRRTYVQEGGTLRPATHYADEQLVTLRGGMQEIVDAAAAAVTLATVVTATSVADITRDDAGYVAHAGDRPFTVDAVVIAVPARHAAPLLRTIAPSAADALGAVPYRSSLTVSAGYVASDVPHALDGYGYMVPGAGPGEVSACTWTSSKIPGRAPAGYALLRGYVHGGPGVTTDRARAVVLAELRRTLGITAEPLFTRAYDWTDALPVLDDDRAQRTAELRATLAEHPGLSIAGGAIEGVGIPDSIRSGRDAADAAWRYVTSAGPPAGLPV